jgi:hypothetical protein
MGVCSDNKRRKYKLNTDVIIENINNLFQNMYVRNSSISEVTEKVISRIASTQTSNFEEWKNFLNEEIKNNEFEQVTKDIADHAIDEAKTSYGDQSFPLLSLLFLANSDRENFITSFKGINITNKTKEAGNNILNVVNTGVKGGLLAGIVSGLGAIHNVAGAVNQVSNPSMIRKYDLKNLILYYINFITLLPASILKKNNEDETAEYIFTVLENSFEKNVLKKYVDSIFNNYSNQEEIKIDEFFGEHLSTLKNDKAIRKDFVEKYIKQLTQNDIRELFKVKKYKK